MARNGALLAGFIALASTTALACGPTGVQIRATQTCEGGNVADCRERCGKDEGMPCYKLGWLTERGDQVDPSFEQAMKLYRQSCDAGWPQACRALGDLYWRGERVELNRPKALEYWQRACGLGLGSACPTQLERDIAEGKLIAKTRADGTLSVSPNVKAARAATSEPTGPAAATP